AQGRSVVHWAALFCHLEHLQLLFKTTQLSRFIDQRDDEGRTPLMLAASSKSADSLACCQFLVQKAHYIVKAQDKEGLSIIHHSCAVNNSQVLNWLLDSGLFDADSSLDLGYRTALHWACKSNSVECVNLLLEKGAKLQGDKTGHSPLHYVARENLHILTDNLLRHFKSDDLLDQCGTTALMQAVMAGSMDVVETFFRFSIVDKDRRDYENRSLLHLAARRGQCSTLQFLLNEKLRLEAVDIHGLTPFLSAVECGQVRCVQILLKAGADASKCDRHGRTALHWAALGGHAYLCQLLIKHGLNPDYADSGGRTPLHCAAFAGHSDCASILIHCGATTIWLPDNDGFSVLHTAAEQGHIKTMKILIEDASLAVNTVCTIDGRELTPLDCALLSKKSTSAVDFLISLGGLSYEALANAAATKIQSTFRSYQVRKMFRRFYRPSKSAD
uniref:Uncharacterized protein n=1 Tax=Romanomermis culicivorax TaxID=13658 RepID=A0A915IAN6_ROMCU